MVVRKKKVNVHYVDNKKFYDEIVKYRARIEAAKEQGKEPPRMPDYIGECIWKIAKGLSYHKRFIRYSFRDEMIDDGIENSILYFHNFDPNKTQNPFAYFTQVIYYAFFRRIAKEERERYTKYKFFQETIIHSVGSEGLIDGDDNQIFTPTMYENITEFMDSFEQRDTEKKRKRKEMKGLQKFIKEEDTDDRPSANTNSILDYIDD